MQQLQLCRCWAGDGHCWWKLSLQQAERFSPPLFGLQGNCPPRLRDLPVEEERLVQDMAVTDGLWPSVIAPGCRLRRPQL